MQYCGKNINPHIKQLLLQFSIGSQLTAIFLYALMLATEKQIIGMTHLLTLRNFLQSAIESNTAFRVENHCFVGLAELIQQHTLQVSSAITQDNKHHVLSCNKHTQRTNHKLHTNLKYCSYHSQFFIDFWCVYIVECSVYDFPNEHFFN